MSLKELCSFQRRPSSLSMNYMFNITFLLFKCGQILLLSIKEFIRNHYGRLMKLHKPSIKVLSLSPKKMLQYAKLYFSKSLVHPQENLFRATFGHIKENQNHLYQIFVPHVHLLAQMLHCVMQFFLFNLLTRCQFIYSLTKTIQYPFCLKSKL